MRTPDVVPSLLGRRSATFRSRLRRAFYGTFAGRRRGLGIADDGVMPAVASDDPIPGVQPPGGDAEIEPAPAPQPPTSPTSATSPKLANDPPDRTERRNVLLFTVLPFCLIVFGVWVVSAGKRYRQEYAQATEGWRVGSSRAVEITVVKDDKYNLACASDQVFGNLACSGTRDLRDSGPDESTLQPYYTIGSEFFLGAGLWNSPELLARALPSERFTVVCTYHITGVVKSAEVRFDANGTFSPVGKTVTVGRFSDCAIPR